MIPRSRPRSTSSWRRIASGSPHARWIRSTRQLSKIGGTAPLNGSVHGEWVGDLVDGLIEAAEEIREFADDVGLREFVAVELRSVSAEHLEAMKHLAVTLGLVSMELQVAVAEISASIETLAPGHAEGRSDR